MKFFRKRKKRPLNFIEVKEKSGVLVQSSKYGCLWIISPFWDVSNPVIINAPGRNIDAVIVINNHIEGCLPLSSFLAADKDIPADKIYVTKIKNHADWHPNYKDQQEINSLVTPIELPETIVIGNLKVSYHGLNDFIEITQEEYLKGFSNKILVGLNIAHSSKGTTSRVQDEIQYDSYHFIGNIEIDNLKETINFFTDVSISLIPKNINIIMIEDWIHGNSKNIIEVCNLIGIDVLSIGKPDTNQELDKYT